MPVVLHVSVIVTKAIDDNSAVDLQEGNLGCS